MWMRLTGHSLARMRLRLLGGLATLLAACGDSTGTGNGINVTGTWTGRLPLGSPSDSIVLVLEDTTGDVGAIGYFDSPHTIVAGQGTVTGDSVRVTVSTFGPSPAPLTVYLDLTAQGPLVGVARVAGKEYPFEFRKADAGAGSSSGRWVLAAVRDPVATAPIASDTLILDARGNARRGYATQACAYTVPGLVRTDAGWLKLEYFSTFGFDTPCAPPSRDSLQVRGDSLVRRTALAGGNTREEMYVKR